MTSMIFGGASPFARALRHGRSARFLTRSDIAKLLLLSDNQVIGLEGDDHSAFYNPAYAERAARRYAAYLGVDAELEGAPHRPFVQATVDERPAPTPVRRAPITMRRRRFTVLKAMRWGLASALAAVAAMFLWSSQHPARPAPTHIADIPDGSTAIDQQPAESPAG